MNNKQSRPMPGGYDRKPKRKPPRRKGWTKKMDERSHVMIEASLERMFGK